MVEPGNICGSSRVVAIQPVFQVHLSGIHAFGQQFMRQVELQPLVGLAGAAVLIDHMRTEQEQ
ncbi:hypothetical protein FQZ97_1270770 [compost metagenome]